MTNFHINIKIKTEEYQGFVYEEIDPLILEALKEDIVLNINKTIENWMTSHNIITKAIITQLRDSKQEQ